MAASLSQPDGVGRGSERSEIMGARIVADAAWHLDKKVPIALIATIAVQSLAIVWWASTITGDVKQTVDRVGRLERNEETARNNQNELEKSVSQIQPQIAELLRSMQRVEGWLQRRESAAQGNGAPGGGR